MYQFAFERDCMWVRRYATTMISTDGPSLSRPRISALALGDEILASDVVHTLADSLGTFSFGEPRTTSLKGLDGDFTVFPVLC